MTGYIRISMVICVQQKERRTFQMKTYKNFKDQVERIETQNDLIDAHIAICQAYSAYKITHAQFDELRNAMILKRLEKKIAWGQGI